MAETGLRKYPLVLVYRRTNILAVTQNVIRHLHCCPASECYCSLLLCTETVSLPVVVITCFILLIGDVVIDTLPFIDILSNISGFQRIHAHSLDFSRLLLAVVLVPTGDTLRSQRIKSISKHIFFFLDDFRGDFEGQFRGGGFRQDSTEELEFCKFVERLGGNFLF